MVIRKTRYDSTTTTYHERAPMNPATAAHNTEFVFDHASQKSVMPGIDGGSREKTTMNKSGAAAMAKLGYT